MDLLGAPAMNTLMRALSAALALLAAPPADAKPAVPAQEVARVKAVVPEGWTVSAEGDTLKVRRDREVETYNNINLPPLGPDEILEYVKGHTRKEPFAITLRFAPRMTVEERERLHAQNDQAAVALRKKEEALEGIPHKFDQYLPSTPAETRLVEEYQKARKTVHFHDLPRFHGERHSLYAKTSPDFDAGFFDGEVGRECRRVEARVFALYTAYDAE